MSVDVAAGDAIVQGDDSSNQGRYAGRVDATYNLTGFTAPAGSNQRYDLVVLKMNDPDDGGSAGRNATIERVAGTAATSPTVPSTPASALLLAVVGPFTSATTSITTSLIHDAQSGTGPSGASAAHLLSAARRDCGVVEAFAGPVAWVPNGALVCAGQAVSRSTYADLFAVIGTTHGSGDGSTTFNLPDYRGRSLFGLDNMGGSDAGRLSASNTLGGAGGAETHTLTEAQIPTLTHSVTDPTHVHPEVDDGGTQLGYLKIESAGSGQAPLLTGSALSTDFKPKAETAAASTGISVANHGGGQAHNNMPPYSLVNWIVWA
jgi:microcystin-dependent protein